MGKQKEQIFECHWIKKPQERIEHDIRIVHLKEKCIIVMIMVILTTRRQAIVFVDSMCTLISHFN